MSGITSTLLDQASRVLGPASVGSQVALMFIFSLAVVLVFNFLRPKSKDIYEPKARYRGDKSPPKVSDSIFGWLPPLYRTKEPELLDKIGLDGVTYLRFGRMMRNLFACIALLGCCVLIPLDAVYNLRHIPASKRNVLTMLTIRDVQGPYLYAHIAASYVITFLTMAFVWWNWSRMLDLRQRWFRSPEYLESLYARTLLITHVDHKHKNDEGIRNILKYTGTPYNATSIHIGRSAGNLPKLIEDRDKAVYQLERDLATCFKNGDIGKRPKIREGGVFGMCGVEKDRIEVYRERIGNMEEKIERCRQDIDTHEAENYGFASMAAVPHAHSLARELLKKYPSGTTVTLAPNPKDIIWHNLNKTTFELRASWWIGFLLLALVCFFNTIPLFVISVLANLSSISAYVGFLARWSQRSPGSFAFVSGVLPPSISNLFAYLLPIIIQKIVEFQGVRTRSGLSRAVVAHYFAFLVISQLIIFTLMGVFFIASEEVISDIGHNLSFSKILNQLSTLPSTISQAYINQSSYWLTFFPLSGFLVIFDLAQIINFVVVFLKKRVFGHTPRDYQKWTEPAEFEYELLYSNTLFMGTVAFVFAPLAPLVTLAGAIVFLLSSWVYKYQLMFVCVTQVETGGRMWNLVVNRILVSVVLMQLLMILTIGLQFSFMSFMWISAIPPVLLVVIFKIVVDRVFYDKFRYYSPVEEESGEVKTHADADEGKNHLEQRFGHPSLSAEPTMPMVYVDKIPLLEEMFEGRIERDKPQMDEYGNKLDVWVVDGIRIAGVEENVDYHPAVYGRDRGELELHAGHHHVMHRSKSEVGSESEKGKDELV